MLLGQLATYLREKTMFDQYTKSAVLKTELWKNMPQAPRKQILNCKMTDNFVSITVMKNIKGEYQVFIKHKILSCPKPP